MNKKILLKEEVKTLNLINTLQNKINEITYIDSSFDDVMKKHFENMTADIKDEQRVRLKITLLNLEELNLIEGDVLVSPRITKEGKEVLSYYKQKESIIYTIIGAFSILAFVLGIKKIITLFK